MKLVDTQCSERCGSNPIGVQVPSRAPAKSLIIKNMDKKNKVWLTAIILVAVIIAVFILLKDSSQENGVVNNSPVEVIDDEATSSEEIVYVESDWVFFEEFLRANISDISPEKEVLGGKFYITNIEWVNEQTAIVDYEDGHIALRAEAELSFTDETKSVVQVERFEMRELPAPVFEETTEEVIEDPAEEVSGEPVAE